MMKLFVKDKEYKVRFSYGVLMKEKLIRRLMDFSEVEEQNRFEELIQITAELLLAGLQKYHKNEFGYDTESEKGSRIEQMYDLMDDYEDESTAEKEQNGYELYNSLQEELFKNGFLSQIMNKAAEEQAIKQDATKLPTDHKGKKK